MSLKEYNENNIAAIVKGDRTILLSAWNLPQLGINDVILAISSVGICGSDLKYWIYGKCGRFQLNGMPMVIGHEASGMVKHVGQAVKHLKPGDRVAIEPGVSCKECEACKSGRYNLCAEMRFCATPPVHGNLCKYYVHDADFCYKLPDHVTSEEGAMIEPLSVAIHTCRRAGVKPNDHVVIFGAGPIGILCGLVAKKYGASQVLLADIDSHRLSVAENFNAADITYCVQRSDTNSVDLAEKLKGVANDNGAHAVLECSGADSSLKTGMHVARPGGCVLLVGRGSMEVELPMVKAGTFEIDVKGIFRYANTYPEAIERVANGDIDVKQLISHRFELQSSQKAFEIASNPSEKAIKIMISCDT